MVIFHTYTIFDDVWARFKAGQQLPRVVGVGVASPLGQVLVIEAVITLRPALLTNGHASHAAACAGSRAPRDAPNGASLATFPAAWLTAAVGVCSVTDLFFWKSLT